MRARSLTLPGLFLVIFCAITWWWLHPSPPLPTTEEPMLTREGDIIHVRPNSTLAKRLKIETITESSTPHIITLPAQLITPASGIFQIYSPVTGRVSAIYVDEGQYVKKGDLLLTILSGDMAQALSDNEKAQAALNFAQTAYHRAKQVLLAGGNAVKDQQSAYNDLLQAQAEAKRAKRKLLSLGEENLKNHNGELNILAPRDGLVSSMNVGVGQNVVDATTILINFSNTEHLILSAAIPENLLSLISPNMVLKANINGEECSGPVAAIDPNLHNDTRRLNLYLPCSNTHGKLYSGQFVTTSLMIPQQQQLLLPKTALLMNNDTISIFVETAQNNYKRRIISVSYDEGAFVRVLTGVSPHEHIVTHGAILLNDY